MRILVCVKQVPDLEALRVETDTHGAVVWDEHAPARMNRYDACALELALRLAESRAEWTVDAVAAGPADWAKTLIRAVGMGARRGLHVQTTAPADPAADVLAPLIRERSYDLVLTGALSEDAQRGETGPRLAAMTDRPVSGRGHRPGL